MGYHIPPLEVRKITGGWGAYPPSVTTGDKLVLSANYTDTYPNIVLNGNSYSDIVLDSGAAVLRIYSETDPLFYIDASTGGEVALYNRLTNNDTYLKTTGSGVIKFGTHTGGGDTVSNGYITIKDAGGTTRKLMTTA